MNCYLRPESFEVNHFFGDQEAAIHSICQKLMEQDAVDTEFEETVLERERLDTTAFFDMLALPHACNEHVKKNTLYVILNQESMPWGEDHVNLIVLAAMEQELLADFRSIYGMFTLVFSKPQNVREVLKAEDYEGFLQIMEKLDLE